MDTIYALSSGAVPAGIAVVRISGAQAGRCLESMAGTLPTPGRLTLRCVLSPADGVFIDKALVLWQPGPSSFTGEDIGEFHLHGSRAVVRAMFDSLAKQGLRPAEAGEFTRRAFGNGKLDLTEVEGVADLVLAETEMQRRQAFAHMDGMLSKLAEGWRSELIELRAVLEARLDFSDEADVGEALPTGFGQRIAELSISLQQAVQSSKAAERIRDGFRVAIVGRPNAGKSTLLNVLAQRDVAIVTAEPGTTRDLLEVNMDLGGYAVRVFDTAGLREATSAAELEGIRRSRQAIDEADLVLWLLDCSDPAVVAPDEIPACAVVVYTKLDLVKSRGRTDLEISAATGQGVADLVRWIGDAAARHAGREAGILTRARQKHHVEDALAALDSAHGVQDEVAAHLLLTASDAIGRLVGRVDIEDVLDRVFAEFCIGK